MRQTRYDVPIWLDLFPSTQRPIYRPLRDRLESEVVIIGGGVAGCATAYALSTVGTRVTLLEADFVGRAATARSSGLVTQGPDVDYRTLEGMYGRRAAQRIWKMTRRAALDLASTARRLRVRCQLETSDAIHFTTREDELPLLQREMKARRTAGLGSVWLSQGRFREVTDIPAWGGMRTQGHSQLDPYRLCLGLAGAAAKRGAAIYERTRVTGITTEIKGVEVKTEAGTVHADRVIVATGSATALCKPLARHLISTHTYIVLTPPLAAKIRASLGRRDAMLRDTDRPYHYVRWTTDHRIMFGGADQKTPPSRRQSRILVQRTGQLMYELSTLYPVLSGVQPEYAWAGPVSTTLDGIPYVGSHRHFPRHLFALGLGHCGVTAGFLASRILMRHHLGIRSKDDELFGFSRCQVRKRRNPAV